MKYLIIPSDNYRGCPTKINNILQPLIELYFTYSNVIKNLIIGRTKKRFPKLAFLNFFIHPEIYNIIH